MTLSLCWFDCARYVERILVVAEDFGCLSKSRPTVVRQEEVVVTMSLQQVQTWVNAHTPLLVSRLSMKFSSITC